MRQHYKLICFLCLLLGSVAFAASLGWEAAVIGFLLCIAGTIYFTQIY